MKTSEFLGQLGEALMTKQPLTPATELGGLPGWDSIGQVEVLSLIDESLGATLPAGSLKKCLTVGDLLALVNSHLSE
jgi:acyl carrier protein